MKTLILADVHLKVSDEGEQTRVEFVRFLRGIDCGEFERIVILGDLFDFWFEYKQVIFSGHFEVLCALHELDRAGVKLNFICGNHDFWAGRFLREHLNITIHSDEFRLTLGDQKILFVHGDGINPRDWPYRVYKKFARSSLVVGAFRLIHPDWAMRIAQGISHGSRTLFVPDDPSDSDEIRAIRDFAEAELMQEDVDVVICGHSHYVEEVEFGSGLYINTGDWMEKRTYLVWNDGTFAREYYEDNV